MTCAESADTTIVPTGATPLSRTTPEGPRSVSADGQDWILVPEGVQYTPEQAVRKFLSLRWEDKVDRMARFLQAEEYLLRMAVFHQELERIPFAGVHLQDRPVQLP